MNFKKGIYNIIFGIIGQLLTVVFAIIVPKVIIIGYGSSVNGLLSTINQLFVYLSLFEAGVGTATLQALYKPLTDNNRGEINSILAATHKYYIRTSKLYFAALTLFSVLYPCIIKRGCISYTMAALLIFFGGLGNVVNFMFQGKYKILLQAEGKSYVVTNITTIISVFINLSKIFLIKNGFDVLTVQIVFFIFNVIQMAFFEIYIRLKYKWIDLKVQPDEKAINQKNSVLVHQIATLVFSNTDMIILSVINGLKAVSLYTVYNYVYTTVLNIFSTINNGLVFYLGQTYHSDRKRFLEIYRLYEFDIMTVGYYMFTVIGVLTLPFMKIYTSGMSDYNYINLWLPLLFVSVQFLSIARFAANNLVNIAGHFKKTQNRAILEAVINIVLSVAFAFRFGIYGILFGTIAALLYRTNDFLIYSNRVILNESAKPSYRVWIADTAIAALCFALFYNRIASCESYYMLAVMGIIYSLIILLIFLVGNLIFNFNMMKANLSLIKSRLARLKKDS